MNAEDKNEISREGLEDVFRRYYSFYEGIVADNEDPLFLGRLKIACPLVYGDQILEKWIRPKGMCYGKNKGMYFLPDKGDTIWVEFQKGDPSYPVWSYGWPLENDAIVDTRDVALIKYDDCRILMNRKDNILTVTNSKGSIELNETSIKAEVEKGSVTIENNKVTLNIDGSTVELQKDKVTLLSGLVSAVKGESLIEYEAKLLSLLSGLNVGGVPVSDISLAPMATSVLFQQLLSDLTSAKFLSTKVKIE
jgi:phage baseplate assembly protein gpV